MAIVPTQSSAAIVARTRRSYRHSRKSPAVRRSCSAATRRMLGPTHRARIADPMPAAPTHHHAARNLTDRVLATIDAAAAEIVAFTSELIRIPTINPPGERYPECAEVIGRRLKACGFDVAYHPAEGRPEHTASHPRVNVVGVRRGRSDRPLVHLNGHFDVVPAGEGWTIDPFAGIVKDGRIYGRGACDMKAGLACAVYAAEAIRRAGIELNGSIEVSGTVDEESGGFAGVAWLAEPGHIHASRTDFVIIPEPLYVDRICIGHRGVYV